MSCYILKKESNGRAICRLCGAKIKKSTSEIVVGFNDSTKGFQFTCLKAALMKAKEEYNEEYHEILNEGKSINRILIYIKKATGKAKCAICKSQLESECDLVINFGQEGHFHFKCINEIFEK